MTKLRVGVIFGGRSGEHEVSLRSAEFILRSLDPAKYDAVPILITKQGQWLSGKEVSELPAADQIRRTVESGVPMPFAGEPNADGPLDVVFPIVHGTFGEDGTLQGLLELAGVPYVGAGVLGSAVGMDKDVMKRLLRDAGLPVVDYWRVLRKETDGFVKTLGDRLPYPVFVKPANLGSSVGISKVSSPDGLRVALENAFLYDRKAVVEQGIDAREIELSVLGNDDPVVSVPGEVRPARDFYDYRAKYIDDDSELIIPAELEPDQVSEARTMAAAVFRTLECSGLARVDLFLEKTTGNFFVNEINTLPGFTAISQYPRLWEVSGLSNTQLVDRLIGLALERHQERASLRTSFLPDSP